MKQAWKKISRRGLPALTALLLIAGCSGKASQPPPAPPRNQISNIEVVPAGEGYEVRVTGSSAPDAKIFKLTDPVRLIVDIANSDVSAVSPTMTVNNDLIEEVTTTATAAGAIGRITITLKDNTSYESRTEGNTLVLALAALGAADEEPVAEEGAAPVEGGDEFAFAEEGFGEEGTPAAEGGPVEGAASAEGAAPAEGTAQEEPFAADEFGFDEGGGFEAAEDEFAFEFGEEPAAAPAAAAAAAEAPAGQATKLTAVRLESGESGGRLVVAADGEIREHDSFTLDNPNRLVVDLPNVANGTGSDVVDASAVSGVGAVTISALPDRVRIVIEHSLPNFEYEISKGGAELVANLRSTGGAAPAGEPAFAEEFAFEEAPVAEAAPAAKDEFAFEEPAAEEPAADDLDTFTFEEPAAAPAEAEAYPVAAPALGGPQVVRVTGIDFLPGKETTSVKISYEGDLETEVVDSTDTEATVRMLNATLGQEFIRALDTSRYVGPIQMVKSFVESTPQGEQGRVVVSLRSHVNYKVRRESGALYLDFPTKAPAPAVAAAPVEAEEAPVSAAEFESFDLGQAAAAEASPEELSLAEFATPGEEISQSYQGRKISLEFREADIRDVLQLIAEVSQLNIIAAEDVQGTVSITLKNVPWDQALDIILETNGLGKKVIGNVIRIAPADQLAAEEEARLAAQQTQEQLEPLAFQIVPVNYADAKDLQPRIQDILSPRGTVTVDERTNSLLIKDIRRSIDQAIETIRALDTQTGQVLIESRVVTTTLTWAREFGVQWGGRFLSAPSVGNNLGNNVIQNNFLVDLPVTAVGQRAGSSMGFSFGTLSQAFNLDVILSAFENSGQGRLVASPRVSVLDNKEAEIKTGISVPITTVQGGTISTTFVDAVLGVKVRPQITSDSSIIMDLEVFDNTINVAIPTAFGNPAINKNEAKTELLVRDGHTVVIGGIVRVQDGFNEIGVPYFNKIPFLGYMFRTREWTDERQEILIFMTPQIVRN